MKLGLIAAASVVALAIGSGTASAQYPVVVPHGNHYHVVPSYSPRVYGGFGYGYPGYSGGFYSPGIRIGFGGYGSWGGHHHHHHDHGHHHGHHGHHHHR